MRKIGPVWHLTLRDTVLAKYPPTHLRSLCLVHPNRGVVWMVSQVLHMPYLCKQNTRGLGCGAASREVRQAAAAAAAAAVAARHSCSCRSKPRQLPVGP